MLRREEIPKIPFSLHVPGDDVGATLFENIRRTVKDPR